MSDRHRKERVGVVISSKTERAAIVQVTRLVQHPVYRKVVRRRKKYVAHNESKTVKVGDAVRIREVKPMSRTKRWRIVEVLGSAQSG